MIQIKDEINKMYGFIPSDETIKKLDNWKNLFIDYNSHTNLMSKGDINVLYEKHVLDSLALYLIDDFKHVKSILDVGCGGGFPSVILSIFFPDIKIFGVDSRMKKITFLSILKNELKLDNFEPICARVEDMKSLNVDILTNRAVGKIEDVWDLSSKHLKLGGWFVSYKALTAENEANMAQKRFKNLTAPLFISYNLPISESLVRKLVVFKKA